MRKANQTVFLLDDDPAVLDAVTMYLEAKGFAVRPYARAHDLLEHIDEAPIASCIVSDIRMPGISGLELQRVLNERGSTVPIILITGHGDIEMAVSAIKAGAANFLEKPLNELRLVTCIEDALSATEKRHAEASEMDALNARRESLTERERQVMDLAARGSTNRQIASQLDISFRTVEIHRGKVMEKMGVASLAELVRISVKLAQ